MNPKYLEKHVAVSQVFTPAAPVSQHMLFAGRTAQLKSVLNAISQSGQHVMVFGERGVGKTSLANVVSQVFEQAKTGNGLHHVRVNCDNRDNFSSLWHKVMRELTVVYRREAVGFPKLVEQGEHDLDSFMPQEIRPDDIRRMLQLLPGLCIIVIDEIDRLDDNEATALLADTVKCLSDHLITATLILVGVADSVDELIAEHHSIERSLLQIQMPRMSRVELGEILQNSNNALKMEADVDARNWIIGLSQGLPHYTHLLGLHSYQNVVSDGRTIVNVDDVQYAIAKSLDETQRTIRSAYHRATSSARQTIYAEVLLACAMAPADELGYFASNDVREPLTRIMGKRYDIPAFSRHLNDFCENKRGPILQKTGTPRSYRFRFINPLMQPYVIMNGLKLGLVETSQLEGLSEAIKGS